MLEDHAVDKVGQCTTVSDFEKIHSTYLKFITSHIFR